jgi:hypothetical protein
MMRRVDIRAAMRTGLETVVISILILDAVCVLVLAALR